MPTRTERRYFLVADFHAGVRSSRTYTREAARRAIRLFRALGNEQAYFDFVDVAV